MKDIVKKSFLLGLGAASLTKKQAEKIVRQLAKKGALNRKDAKQLVKRVASEANKHRKNIQSIAQKEAYRIKNNLGLVSKAEAKKMKARISTLEKRLRAEGRKTAKKLLSKVSR